VRSHCSCWLAGNGYAPKKDKRAVRTPIRFRRFVVGYGLIVAGLALGPSTTIYGGTLSVPVREGIAANPIDLAFDGASSVDVPENRSIAVRSSAAALIDESSSPTPVRISIPQIGIDGAVVPVGIADDRQLDVPFADTAGWYQHSATADGAGATVLAAHVDYGGGPGLFFNLRLAKVGDVIEVAQSDQSTTRYLVAEVALYDKADLPAEDLFRSSGAHALHLVTCGGSFDRISRSYRGNQVVTAIPLRQ